MSTFYEVINPGGCLMQNRWDFADADYSGKWSAYQPIYRHRVTPSSTTVADEYKTGSALVIAKLKIRGRGRALKLRFKAEPDKDLQLVGYSISNNGNAME